MGVIVNNKYVIYTISCPNKLYYMSTRVVSIHNVVASMAAVVG